MTEGLPVEEPASLMNPTTANRLAAVAPVVPSKLHFAEDHQQTISDTAGVASQHLSKAMVQPMVPSRHGRSGFRRGRGKTGFSRPITTSQQSFPESGDAL